MNMQCPKCNRFMHIYCIGHDQWFQCYVCDITTMRPNMGEEIINVSLTIYERFWKKYYELKNKFIHYYKMLMSPRYKRNSELWKRFTKSWKRVEIGKHELNYTWTPDASTILNFPDMPILYLPYHRETAILDFVSRYGLEKDYKYNPIVFTLINTLWPWNTIPDKNKFEKDLLVAIIKHLVYYNNEMNKERIRDLQNKSVSHVFLKNIDKEKISGKK